MTCLPPEEWEPSEEGPRSEGEYVDVWLYRLGGEIMAGQFVRNREAVLEAEANLWFDEDRYLINPETVLYWMRRVDTRKPEPPH